MNLLVDKIIEKISDGGYEPKDLGSFVLKQFQVMFTQ